MDFEKGMLRHIGLASIGVGAFLCMALPASSPARAGDDNVFSPVSNFLTAPFGGGKPAAATIDDNSGAIDYRPRPALVVPPTNDLPPPHASVTRSADWPKDPDATALRRAKADSRRPAPSTESQSNGDAAHGTKEVVLQGPKCGTVVGMPACFTTPWGEINLPGTTKGGSDQAGVHLSTTATRTYLIEPPVSYMEAVELSPEESGKVEDRVDQKLTATAAPGGASPYRPPTSCMFPGMLGCPQDALGVTSAKQPNILNGQYEEPGPGPGASAAPSAAAPSITASSASAPSAAAPSSGPPKQCLFPGMLGCPKDALGVGSPQQPDVLTGQYPEGAQEAATAAAQNAAQRPASACKFPGWFGCPEN
jgi:hypothetical protein